MNNKRNTITIDMNTLKPINNNVVETIPGTEDGHFYGVDAINDELVLAHRRLDVDVETEDPINGPETRIRIIPTNQVSDKTLALIKGLNFTPKTTPNNQGEKGLHFSEVVKDAETVINLLTLRLF